MLKTENYKEQILEMYKRGVKPQDIAKNLGFSYWQPVYNLLKKEGVFIPKTTEYKKKYTLDENFFQEINTEEKAYILGFVCADGHIGKDRLTISLSIKDINVLKKIKTCLNSNVPIKHTSRRNPYSKGKPICEMVTVQFSSVKLVAPLFHAGLKSDKTYNLNSSILKIVPEKLISCFLRGYFDGDGNVMFGKRYTSGYKYNINICGNEEFLINTYQKYFPTTNKLYFEKKSKQMCVWKITSKQKVSDFLVYLYKDAKIYLERKYNVYKQNMLM